MGRSRPSLTPVRDQQAKRILLITRGKHKLDLLRIHPQISI